MEPGSSTTTPSAFPRPAGGKGCLHALAGICCWGYLVLMLGVWLVMMWSDLWWPATLLIFAPRWVLLVPLGLLALVTLVVRPRALGLLLLSAGLIAGPIMGLCLPWRGVFQDVPPGKPFRVFTCNMHYGRGDPEPLETLVDELAPDIAAIQEWGASERSTFRTKGGWHVHESRALFVASRHPIRNVVQLGADSMDEQGAVTRYDLDTPLGVVHLFSLHLATVLHGVTDTIHDKKGGEGELEANIRRRWEQSRYIADQANEIKGPLLLVGDFNTPPQSAIFARVWDDYHDAFGWAGTGWGYTFFGSRTMVRIDHILAGKNWYCRSCRVGPHVGSPHRPVIADLVWPDAARE